MRSDDPVRSLAVEVLVEVEKGVFLKAVLEGERGKLPGPGPEQGRLHFLTTGTTKWRGRLDFELDSRLPKGVDSLPPKCRALLRLALFELRMADVPDYAVVDSAVDMTHRLGMEGLSGLVNAVLRTAAREGEPDPTGDRTEKLSVLTSHPVWLIEKITDSFGFEAAADLAEWDNIPAPVWVRVNRSRVSLDRARHILEEQGVAVEREGPVPGYLLIEQGIVPGQIVGIVEGWLTVHDPSAGLAGLMAAPSGGMVVADICAAPGGKSTHMAELGGTGTIVDAADSDPARLEMLRHNVHRHGGKSIRVLRFEEVLAGVGSYDIVLVDAPCSNLGVLRRRADARWRVGPEDLSRLATVQFELIEKGAELVRPGGVLVYSTCTIVAEENEMVVESFLSQHDEFDRDEVPQHVPAAFINDTGTVASLPWQHGIDGAFAVRLIRRNAG